MTKTLFASLAAVGIALGTAGTASATEGSFLDAIESQGHYATTAPGTDDEAVDVGYRACQAFDRGGANAAVQTVLSAYNGDTSSSRQYYATLFAQAAAYHLCPEHNGEIGPI